VDPNNDERSSTGPDGGRDVSSRSMRDSSFLVDAEANSAGIGFEAATKSPFLNESYRLRTVLI
jgi:hypothetical protein